MLKGVWKGILKSSAAAGNSRRPNGSFIKAHGVFGFNDFDFRVPWILGFFVDTYDYWSHAILYGKDSPRPEITNMTPDEISFRVPAGGLDKEDIKMTITPNHGFLLQTEKMNGYEQFLYLPQKANFEKATYSASLEDGLVEVTIKDYARKPVVVTFDDK